MYSGFKPSRYSFQQGNNWYLEEDCDAIGYLKALHGDQWIKHCSKISERFVNKEIEDLLEIIKERSDQISDGVCAEWIEHKGFAYLI